MICEIFIILVSSAIVNANPVGMQNNTNESLVSPSLNILGIELKEISLELWTARKNYHQIHMFHRHFKRVNRPRKMVRKSLVPEPVMKSLLG